MSQSSAIGLLLRGGRGPFDGQLVSPPAARPQPAVADSPPEVAGVLLRYLGRRLGLDNLAYAAPPAELSSGWETYTYEFRLRDSDPLPRPFAGPLVLRAFVCPQGLPAARREFAVTQFLARSNFPVPEPLLLEESSSYLRGPFLLRPRVPGRPLLKTALRYPWTLFSTAEVLADTHARLHAVPAEAFSSAGDWALERSLDEGARAIRRCGLDGLRDALHWLNAHRPPRPPSPSILHLDFHPLNLIRKGGEPPIVLDWTESGVGDYHADVGMTLMLLECAPPDDLGPWDRFCAWVGRSVFRAWYLHAYGKRARLNEEKLAYYRAWAAFHRLCRYGRWLRVGPAETGYKPSAVRHLKPGHLRKMARYFHAWSGVSITL